MPNYKVVDADKLDADLKYVADKIRAKAETTEQMDFPLGYGDVVDSISKGENLDSVLTEQEALVTELQGILDQKAAGSSEEINLGTCTVIIKPVASTNHYVCRETVASDGTVSYAISKSYTSSNISVKARCDSVMYVQVSNAKSADVTGAELLQFISGQGVVIKTPSDNGATATITLKA